LQSAINFSQEMLITDEIARDRIVSLLQYPMNFLSFIPLNINASDSAALQKQKI